jgi:hypothetical protein
MYRIGHGIIVEHDVIEVTGLPDRKSLNYKYSVIDCS